jgi:hypothetical protein
MTAARQQRKRFAALCGLTLAGFAALAPGFGKAAAPQPVVVNAQTGLAISGFDPVAYFTDAKAVLGRPDLELSRDGVVWRFRNEGNRAAFLESPDVYMPRFGGYDPVAIARGASVPGHPQIWSVVADRVYLFYSNEARAAFVADPGRYIDAAERKWPAVQRTIGR